MSAIKRSVSMDRELYDYVMKRSRQLKYHDKGSGFIQQLIRADMEREREVRPKLIVSEEKIQPRPSKRRN